MGLGSRLAKATISGNVNGAGGCNHRRYSGKRMFLMNATYWKIKEGQLKPGETVHTGHAEKDAADQEAGQLPAALVGKLKTIESDYPKDDPRYEPFPSARWCVIVRD
jgi:hypothetical protein